MQLTWTGHLHQKLEQRLGETTWRVFNWLGVCGSIAQMSIGTREKNVLIDEIHFLRNVTEPVFLTYKRAGIWAETSEVYASVKGIRRRGF